MPVPSYSKTPIKVPVYAMTRAGYHRVSRKRKKRNSDRTRIACKIKQPDPVQNEACPWCGEGFTAGESVITYDNFTYHKDCFEQWGAAQIYEITGAEPHTLRPKALPE